MCNTDLTFIHLLRFRPMNLYEMIKGVCLIQESFSLKDGIFMSFSFFFRNPQKTITPLGPHAVM